MSPPQNEILNAQMAPHHDELLNAQMASPHNELLNAQALIWNHTFYLINSFSLKCAVQLAIPDAIHKHGRPMTISALAEALSINKSKANFLSRLMRILTKSGFFFKSKIVSETEEKIETEGYSLSLAGRMLLKDDPCSMSPFVVALLDQTMTDPYNQLSNWFRNDLTSPFETTHGIALWEFCDSHETEKVNLVHTFNQAMANDSFFVSGLIVNSGKNIFEGINKLVDVGGGTGNMIKAIANSFPQMSCVCLDLPHVVAGLKVDESIKNLTYVGADMFDSLPPADAFLFKWIFHDWGDDECVKILKECKERILSTNKSGKVIVIEMVVDNDQGDLETQLLFDMAMMTLVKGREREEKDWAMIFSDAGFNHYKIIPLLGLRSLIEVYL